MIIGTTFTNGDKVKIDYPESTTNGFIATYMNPTADGISHRVLMESGEERWYQTRYLKPHVEETINRYTSPVSYEVLREEKERLEKQVAHWRSAHETVERINRSLWSDFSKINDALAEEASDRNWCEDYEKFVNALNERMESFSLDLPEVEYNVTVQRIRTVYEQTTVIVSGRRGISERDLRDAAFEEAYGSYDWHENDDDVSDDYEIIEMEEA